MKYQTVFDLSSWLSVTNVIKLLVGVVVVLAASLILAIAFSRQWSTDRDSASVPEEALPPSGISRAAPAKPPVTARPALRTDRMEIHPHDVIPIKEEGPISAPSKLTASKSNDPRRVFQIAAPTVCEVIAHGAAGGRGSGFFVSRDGLVVTNLHVIAGATDVSVRLADGSDATLLGIAAFDAENDLVALRVAGTSFVFLRVSLETPDVGTRVYAIGNPKGLSQSLSDGLISGHRVIDGTAFIQTTAPISPGSSGGPLLLSDGTVVGVTTASRRGGQNLNLAISATQLKRLVDEAVRAKRLANITVIPASVKVTIEDDSKILASIHNAILENRLAEALRSLSEIAPERRGFGYWMALGHVHCELRNHELSVEAFGKAAELAPERTEPLLRTAVAFFVADSREVPDSWKIVREMCDDVIKRDPANARPYNLKAQVATDEHERIGLLETAVRLDPTHLGAWYNLAIARLRSRNWEGAIRDFRRAEELLHKSGEFKFFAQTPRTSNREVIDYTSTESVEVLIQFGYAEARSQQNDRRRAIDHYHKILQLEPENRLAMFRIAGCYRAMTRDDNNADVLYWERRSRWESLDILAAIAAPPSEFVLLYVTPCI